jgi:hypothetical protein
MNKDALAASRLYNYRNGTPDVHLYYKSVQTSTFVTMLIYTFRTANFLSKKHEMYIPLDFYQKYASKLNGI